MKKALFLARTEPFHFAPAQAGNPARLFEILVTPYQSEALAHRDNPFI
jgi:hypothetical protein